MYTHSLFDILKTFSDKELMRFGKFLKSPYFNNSAILLKVFTVLRSYYPEFDNKMLTKENIFRRVYSKAEYNDSTFRNLMSDLLKFALQFLKEEAFRKNEIETSLFLTDELAMRGLVKVFSEKIQDTDRNLGDGSDTSLFLSKFRTQSDQFYMNLQSARVLKKGFVEAESKRLVQGIVFLLSHFVIESVRHMDNLLKYSRTFNISVNTRTISDFMELFDISKTIRFINHHSELKLPIVEAYFKMLVAYLNFEDDRYYFDLKHFLKKNSDGFSLIDNHFLFARLTDYCVLKKNSGALTNFVIDDEIFDLLTEIINKGYYRTESTSFVPFDLYRNYLYNCISLRKLDKMEEFIQKFSGKLNPNQVSNVENYSYSLLYFERGEFSDALDRLNRIRFDQFIYKLDMKNLTLKIHYELGQFDSALSVIDTYRHFVKNNVLVSDNRSKLHNNFINYVSKLIQFKTYGRSENLEYIEDKLKKSKDTFNKEWILEKINELKKNPRKKAV